jgi:hypothetical protein
MAQHNKVCPYCKVTGHSGFYCKQKPIKPIKRVAIKKTTPKKTKVVKLSRSKIKKQLDKLVKDYIKQRDNHIDQRSGEKVEGVNCHASHVFPVGSCSVLQFEPLNMIVLSYHNHINWWHKNPIEAAEWFERKFPERLAQLNIMKQTKTKTSTVELQELVELYKGLLLTKDH